MEDTARVYGNVAFANEQKRIPCLDSNLMDLLKKGEGQTLAILDAWLRGWDECNLLPNE